jgi:type IV secretion system protein VirB10
VNSDKGGEAVTQELYPTPEGVLTRPALRRGSQDSINQSGQQLVRRQINVQPTLTIRPGFPVRVVVNCDVVLAQYQG